MGPLVAVTILSFVCFADATPISTVQTLEVYDDSGDVPIAEEVEFNSVQNVAIFRLPGEDDALEAAVVLDFEKGVTGVYDAKSQRCFLANDLASTDSVNADELLKGMEALADDRTPGDTGVKELVYEMSAEEPVDASLLPATLQDACVGLPVLKMVPSIDVDSEAETNVQETRQLSHTIFRQPYPRPGPRLPYQIPGPKSPFPRPQPPLRPRPIPRRPSRSADDNNVQEPRQFENNVDEIARSVRVVATRPSSTSGVHRFRTDNRNTIVIC